jgi:hypothetical protein
VLRQVPQSRHHPERYRAVAAENESKVAARQQWLEPVDQLPQRRSRLAGVLGQRVIPVGAPCLVRQVSVVMHLEPGGGELAEQAGRAQRRGRQVLAGRIAGRAARHAHH